MLAKGMNEVKIFVIYSEFLGKFTVNFRDSFSLHSLAYPPMCESSMRFSVWELIFCHADFKNWILHYRVLDCRVN